MIVALAFFDVFDTDVAVKVTVAGFGTLAGAVYVMGAPEALDVADKVPHVLPLQPVPDNVQSTPRFFRSFRTVAVKDCVPPPACTLALVGETLTVIRDCAKPRGTPSKTTREEKVMAATMDFLPGTKPRLASNGFLLRRMRCTKTAPFASRWEVGVLNPADDTQGKSSNGIEPEDS